MKTLIVYFSLEGNTEYAANRIKEKTGADLLRLIPKKAYADKGFKKFFRGGKSAVFKDKPNLEEYDAMGIFNDPLARKNEGTDSDIDEFAGKIAD